MTQKNNSSVIVTETVDLAELADKVNKLYDSLNSPIPGQSTSLLEDIYEMNRAYKRASWLSKGLMFIIPTLAVLLTSWGQITQWLGKAVGSN